MTNLRPLSDKEFDEARTAFREARRQQVWPENTPVLDNAVASRLFDTVEHEWLFRDIDAEDEAAEVALIPTATVVKVGAYCCKEDCRQPFRVLKLGPGHIRVELAFAGHKSSDGVYHPEGFYWLGTDKLTALACLAPTFLGEDAPPPAIAELMRQATRVRSLFENYFSKDTAAVGTTSPIPSAGHCAVAALLAQNMFDGELVSASVMGMSHWFNRVRYDGAFHDVDLTADQFGYPPIQVAGAGKLYKDTQVRSRSEVAQETINRANLLHTKSSAWLKSEPCPDCGNTPPRKACAFGKCTDY